MKKPEPLKPEQLEPKNPVARKSKWNGDKIRTTDKQGFSARREAAGLTVVEGSNRPSKARTVHRPFARVVQPPEAPPMTDRQKRMFKKK